ncbi:carboxypeptidase [Tersicoccus solisilvae]|uniref:Carboxypeptidase n=1 Tax=Tersicoccus solisilvae TaxID=1882339 RepID=A0ABQ1NMU9_9MICC|nr:transglycosylase domain-containing protein [Tersicoccus solisilvae]GGC80873.1 carboxypeptidase [Tersicoccus solisilvae]
MAAGKSPGARTISTLARFLTFLGVSALCGVLTAGLLVPGAAVSAMSATASMDFFDELPTELEVGPLSVPSRVLAADGSELATFFVENRQPVKLDQMSPYVKQSLLAIEDSRFYEHGGVDVQGTVRALLNNVAGGSTQGASSITQQYVNNVLNEARSRAGQDASITLNGAKGIGDKLREAKLAIAVEKKYTKDQILENYLNIVFYNPNAYGVEAAAQYFWGVSAKNLNLQQSAMLAGLVNGPTLYNPVTQPKQALQRRNLVLDVMLAQKKITKAQHDAAVKAPLALKLNAPKQGCAAASRAPYFCSYVEQQIYNNAAFGQTREDRQALLLRGGLTIKTTLDPRLQDTAQAQVDRIAPPRANPSKIGSSLVTVQPGTGKVLAMAQNSRLTGQGNWINEINFNVDKKDGGGNGWQPGSTYKPITLATWLDEGHHTQDIVNAAKRRYPADFPWKASCATADHGVVGAYDDTLQDSHDLKNAEEGWYRRMTAAEGIYQSINTATYAMASKVDLCNMGQIAQNLGIHNASTGAPIDSLKIASFIGGTEGVSPLTMASAFATFSTDGKYCAPVGITSVTDRNNKNYEVPQANCRQTIKSEVAQGVNSVLQEVLVRGSGYLRGIGVPAAAKTGTTDNSEYTWMVGYTKGLASASWVGFPDGYRSPNARNGNPGAQFYGDGTTSEYVDGATVAGGAWQAYMREAAPLYDTGDFTDPPQSVVRGTTVPGNDDDNGSSTSNRNDDDNG